MSLNHQKLHILAWHTDFLKSLLNTDWWNWTVHWQFQNICLVWKDQTRGGGINCLSKLCLLLMFPEIAPAFFQLPWSNLYLSDCLVKFLSLTAFDLKFCPDIVKIYNHGNDRQKLSEISYKVSWKKNINHCHKVAVVC